jgi:hypothetical protein
MTPSTIQNVFSVGSVQSAYKRREFRNKLVVTLRLVGGDEKGSLKSETVKYGHKFQGTRTREILRWQGPAAYTKDRPVLSSERAPHGIKNLTLRRIPYSERKKKIWS